MEWEFHVLDALQQYRTPFGDAVCPILSVIGAHGELWIVLTLILLSMKKTRRTGFVLGAALLFELALCSGILKPLIDRPRPYEINTAIRLIAAHPASSSFPSGHTASAFAAAGGLWLQKSRLRWAGLAVALIMAFSRLYLYMHFPTDVLGGLLLGLFCAWLGKITVDKIYAYRAVHSTAGKDDATC